MTEDVNDSDSIIMVTQRGAMKRIDFNVLQKLNAHNVELLY